MKEPAEWKEEDLQLLIDNGAEEGPRLEFKSAGALTKTEREKTEISKDVSSFANSAGGVIVYGIDEEPEPPHKAAKLSQINAREFSKEWLEQVINSRIQPRIQGLAINSISGAGGTYYVLVVPQSFTAHQAYDKRYYKRFNFQSVQMEDYEIRQVINRQQKPIYRLGIISALKHEAGQAFITIRVVIENVSEIMAENVSVVLFCPEVLVQGPKAMAHGPNVINEISYLGVPGNKLITALSPLTKSAMSFRDFPIRLPRHDEGLRFELIARTYDQHGQADETIFKLSGEDGSVLSAASRPREKLY